MWRQWLVVALRTAATVVGCWCYVAGYILLEASLSAIGDIVGGSVLAAAVVSFALGRARYMYIAAFFVLLGIGVYPFASVALPVEVIAILVVIGVGGATIAYGAAELRVEGGEPLRDPIAMLLLDDEDDDYIDEIYVPTARVLASDRYAATKNRHDLVPGPC